MRGIHIAIGLCLAYAMFASCIAEAARPKQGSPPATMQRTTPSSMESPEPKFVNPPSEKKKNWIVNEDSLFVAPSARLLSDQKDIWTTPLRLHWTDAEWLVPVAGITTGTFLTDKNLSHSLCNKPTTLHLYDQVRTGSVVTLGAASGGLYLWSLHTHDPHQRETGLLASEAVLDSLVLTQGLKFVTGRERPEQGHGQGTFLAGGNSFPSSHSAAAWAAAGVLAHEYPGPMTKLIVYGLASTVSIASVGSKQHFPSDVLIGSGLGWLLSAYVYRAHHNPGLGGSAWSPIGSLIHDEQTGAAGHAGSNYVPLDSWVYPAIERLAALGYVNSAFLGTRPWSREQCRQLLQDAESLLGGMAESNISLDSQTRELVLALQHEFARGKEFPGASNQSLEIESIYTRVLSAEGTVLDDGYHFGQTVGYDFGRPFRRGTNFIAGGAASATYGSLFFYVSGEYQHAPAAPSLSSAEIQFIADHDSVAAPPSTPFDSINEFRFLDAYAGLNLHGWQVLFGNQSLSWGPGIGGSLLLSNNAGPFPMLRISPAGPIEIPGLSRIFGAFHVEQFYGRLAGFPGASQPWIYGQKISVRPSHSLEFAYGRTTLIGGTGHPLTSSSFFKSVFGRVDAAQNSVPGDSRTAVEWTWRLPKIGNWATFYGELEDDDDPIPLQNLAKSVWRPGLYVPRLPFLPRWDAHIEWTSSTSPGRGSLQNHGSLNYWNLDYTSGYTNDGSLMGNTVGREGIALQAWMRYWFAPRQTLDFSWKQSRVLTDYIPGGGKWQDFQTGYSFTSHSGIYLKGLLQFEHISSFPLLFPGARNNVTASLEIGFLPPWAHRDGGSPYPNDGYADRQPQESSR